VGRQAESRSAAGRAAARRRRWRTVGRFGVRGGSGSALEVLPFAVL
jgi:hypothetical protein